MAKPDYIHALASGYAAASAETGTATVVALPLALMARFRRLMQYEGEEVDIARMCTDTRYAYRCLATAHTSSSEQLRRAALVLFEAYDRNASVVH